MPSYIPLKALPFIDNIEMLEKSFSPEKHLFYSSVFLDGLILKNPQKAQSSPVKQLIPWIKPT